MANAWLIVCLEGRFLAVSFLFLAWLVSAYLALHVGNFQCAFITLLITLFHLLVKILVLDITEHGLVDQS